MRATINNGSIALEWIAAEVIWEGWGLNAFYWRQVFAQYFIVIKLKNCIACMDVNAYAMHQHSKAI